MTLQCLFNEIKQVLEQSPEMGDAEVLLLKRTTEDFAGSGTFCTEFAAEFVEDNCISIKEIAAYAE